MVKASSLFHGNRYEYFHQRFITDNAPSITIEGDPYQLQRIATSALTWAKSKSWIIQSLRNSEGLTLINHGSLHLNKATTMYEIPPAKKSETIHHADYKHLNNAAIFHEFFNVKKCDQLIVQSGFYSDLRSIQSAVNSWAANRSRKAVTGFNNGNLVITIEDKP